jgi:glycosyltransferase involved in cell wall biosynthesis
VNRVIFISNYWKSVNGGGISVFLANLVPQLKKKGNRITVIAKDGIDDQQIFIKKSKPVFAIITLLYLFKLKPGVICSNNDWYCLLPASVYSFFFRVTLIHIFHTQPERKLKPLLRKIMSHFLKRCTSTVFVSDFLKNYFIREEGLYFKNPVVIYAGTPVKENNTVITKEKARKQLNLDNDDIVFATNAMTSNRLKTEGLLLLLNAIKKVPKREKIKLVITKNGKFNELVMKKVHENGLAGQILFTKTVANIYDVYAAADLYIHITYAEGGVSLSILEAISFGLPVIASRTGGIPELKEKGVPLQLIENNSDLICKAIESFINGKAVSPEVLEEAKCTVMSKFNWSETADAFLKQMTPHYRNNYFKQNSQYRNL